jgi:hypothetical protein
VKVRHRPRAVAAGAARLAVSIVIRAAPALLIGIALIGGLSLGLLPVALRLYAQRRSLAASYDSRLLDGVVLAVNAALLVALIKVDGLGRRSAPSTTRQDCSPQATHVRGGRERPK